MEKIRRRRRRRSKRRRKRRMTGIEQGRAEQCNEKRRRGIGGRGKNEQ